MKKIVSSKSKELIEEIQCYLTCMSDSSAVFLEGVGSYFAGEKVKLDSCRKEISRIESEADRCLNNIRQKMYALRLVPDARADVFEMLEDMDDLVDISKQTLLQLCIEKPEGLNLCRGEIFQITRLSKCAVDELVNGIQAYFSSPRLLDDCIQKVYYYEKEVDKLEERIKRYLFALPEIGLARKVQARYFVDKIAMLSDKAEGIAKNLLIYKIKRTI